MSGYLQRLLERAGATPPALALDASAEVNEHAVSAGPVLSPLAELDQRLQLNHLDGDLLVAMLSIETERWPTGEADVTAPATPAGQPREQPRPTPAVDSPRLSQARAPEVMAPVYTSEPVPDQRQPERNAEAARPRISPHRVEPPATTAPPPAASDFAESAELRALEPVLPGHEFGSPRLSRSPPSGIETARVDLPEKQLRKFQPVVTQSRLTPPLPAVEPAPIFSETSRSSGSVAPSAVEPARVEPAANFVKSPPPSHHIEASVVAAHSEPPARAEPAKARTPSAPSRVIETPRSDQVPLAHFPSSASAASLIGPLTPRPSSATIRGWRRR